jgi:hypothetical protein
MSCPFFVLSGHRLQIIEAVLAANGYPEAAEFIDQPRIHNG